MDALEGGLVLVWGGGAVLLCVWLIRLRAGAWGFEALDEGPPVRRWLMAAAGLGLGSAMVGAGLLVWSQM